jgi:hypothetical protein
MDLENDPLKYLLNTLQTFIVEPKFRVDVTRRGYEDLEAIATQLSRVATFLEIWGDALFGWPEESRNLWPLVHSLNRIQGCGRQGLFDDRVTFFASTGMPS